MAKSYSWYEVVNPDTGKTEYFRDPLRPDSFPEDDKEKKECGISTDDEVKKPSKGE